MSLPELYSNSLRVEARETKEMDDTGKVITMAMHFPIWVEPRAGGRTPMCAALTRAKQLAEQWVVTHPDNYPPVVINVTDGGAATDGDLARPAQALRQVRTTNSELLLFHWLIRSRVAADGAGAASGEPGSEYRPEQQLYGISSDIPHSDPVVRGCLGDWSEWDLADLLDVWDPYARPWPTPGLGLTIRRA